MEHVMKIVSVLFHQVVIEWKLYARDRVALFWALVFPVVLLLGFGTLFTARPSQKATLVCVSKDGNTSMGTHLEASMTKAGIHPIRLSPEAAEQRWKKGQTVAQLESDGEHWTIRLNSYLIMQGQNVADRTKQAILTAQAASVGATLHPIKVLVETPGHGQATNYAAFLLPGLIGLNLLSMGLFGIGMSNISNRESGKYKRFAVTPLPVSIFLLGQVIHRVSVIIVQTTVLLLCGYFLLGIQNQGSLFTALLIIAAGTASFIAVGFALSSFVGTVEVYGVVSNIIYFPMMFLSGVYFPLDFFPSWLQTPISYLPLAPYLRALRNTLNDGVSLMNNLPAIGIVVAWGCVAFLVAVKKYRWT